MPDQRHWHTRLTVPSDAPHLQAVYATCVPRYYPDAWTLGCATALDTAEAVIVATRAQRPEAFLIARGADADGGAILSHLVVDQRLGDERIPAARAVCAGTLRWCLARGMLTCRGNFHVDAAAALCRTFGGTLEEGTGCGVPSVRFDVRRCLDTLIAEGF